MRKVRLTKAARCFGWLFFCITREALARVTSVMARYQQLLLSSPLSGPQSAKTEPNRPRVAESLISIPRQSLSDESLPAVQSCAILTDTSVFPGTEAKLAIAFSQSEVPSR